MLVINYKVMEMKDTYAIIGRIIRKVVKMKEEIEVIIKVEEKKNK